MGKVGCISAGVTTSSKFGRAAATVMSRPANFKFQSRRQQRHTRHLSSKLKASPTKTTNASVYLPPSHTLPVLQDSYHTNTAYLHLRKACHPPPPSSVDLRHTKTPCQLASHVPNRWIGAHSPVKMTLYYTLVSSLALQLDFLSSLSHLHPLSTKHKQHIPCQAITKPS